MSAEELGGSGETGEEGGMDGSISIEALIGFDVENAEKQITASLDNLMKAINKRFSAGSAIKLFDSASLSNFENLTNVLNSLNTAKFKGFNQEISASAKAFTDNKDAFSGLVNEMVKLGDAADRLKGIKVNVMGLRGGPLPTAAEPVSATPGNPIVDFDPSTSKLVGELNAIVEAEKTSRDLLVQITDAAINPHSLETLSKLADIINSINTEAMKSVAESFVALGHASNEEGLMNQVVSLIALADHGAAFSPASKGIAAIARSMEQLYAVAPHSDGQTALMTYFDKIISRTNQVVEALGNASSAVQSIGKDVKFPELSDSQVEALERISNLNGLHQTAQLMSQMGGNFQAPVQAATQAPSAPEATARPAAPAQAATNVTPVAAPVAAARKSGAAQNAGATNAETETKKPFWYLNYSEEETRNLKTNKEAVKASNNTQKRGEWRSMMTPEEAKIYDKMDTDQRRALLVQLHDHFSVKGMPFGKAANALPTAATSSAPNATSKEVGQIVSATPNTSAKQASEILADYHKRAAEEEQQLLAHAVKSVSESGKIDKSQMHMLKAGVRSIVVSNDDKDSKQKQISSMISLHKKYASEAKYRTPEYQAQRDAEYEYKIAEEHENTLATNGMINGKSKTPALKLALSVAKEEKNKKKIAAEKAREVSDAAALAVHTKLMQAQYSAPPEPEEVPASAPTAAPAQRKPAAKATAKPVAQAAPQPVPAQQQKTPAPAAQPVRPEHTQAFLDSLSTLHGNLSKVVSDPDAMAHFTPMGYSAVDNAAEHLASKPIQGFKSPAKNLLLQAFDKASAEGMINNLKKDYPLNGSEKQKKESEAALSKLTEFSKKFSSHKAGGHFGTLIKDIAVDHHLGKISSDSAGEKIALLRSQFEENFALLMHEASSNSYSGVKGLDQELISIYQSSLHDIDVMLAKLHHHTQEANKPKDEEYKGVKGAVKAAKEHLASMQGINQNLLAGIDIKSAMGDLVAEHDKKSGNISINRDMVKGLLKNTVGMTPEDTRRGVVLTISEWLAHELAHKSLHALSSAKGQNGQSEKQNILEKFKKNYGIKWDEEKEGYTSKNSTVNEVIEKMKQTEAYAFGESDDHLEEILAHTFGLLHGGKATRGMLGMDQHSSNNSLDLLGAAMSAPVSHGNTRQAMMNPSHGNTSAPVEPVSSLLVKRNAGDDRSDYAVSVWAEGAAISGHQLKKLQANPITKTKDTHQSKKSSTIELPSTLLSEETGTWTFVHTAANGQRYSLTYDIQSWGGTSGANAARNHASHLFKNAENAAKHNINSAALSPSASHTAVDSLTGQITRDSGPGTPSVMAGDAARMLRAKRMQAARAQGGSTNTNSQSTKLTPTDAPESNSVAPLDVAPKSTISEAEFRNDKKKVLVAEGEASGHSAKVYHTTNEAGKSVYYVRHTAAAKKDKDGNLQAQQPTYYQALTQQDVIKQAQGAFHNLHFIEKPEATDLGMSQAEVEEHIARHQEALVHTKTDLDQVKLKNIDADHFKELQQNGLAKRIEIQNPTSRNEYFSYQGNAYRKTRSGGAQKVKSFQHEQKNLINSASPLSHTDADLYQSAHRDMIAKDRIASNMLTHSPRKTQMRMREEDVKRDAQHLVSFSGLANLHRPLTVASSQTQGINIIDPSQDGTKRVTYLNGYHEFIDNLAKAHPYSGKTHEQNVSHLRQQLVGISQDESLPEHERDMAAHIVHAHDTHQESAAREKAALDRANAEAAATKEATKTQIAAKKEAKAAAKEAADAQKEASNQAKAAHEAQDSIRAGSLSDLLKNLNKLNVSARSQHKGFEEIMAEMEKLAAASGFIAERIKGRLFISHNVDNRHGVEADQHIVIEPGSGGYGVIPRKLTGKNVSKMIDGKKLGQYSTVVGDVNAVMKANQQSSAYDGLEDWAKKMVDESHSIATLTEMQKHLNSFRAMVSKNNADPTKKKISEAQESFLMAKMAASNNRFSTHFGQDDDGRTALMLQDKDDKGFSKGNQRLLIQRDGATIRSRIATKKDAEEKMALYKERSTFTQVDGSLVQKQLEESTDSTKKDKTNKNKLKDFEMLTRSKDNSIHNTKDLHKLFEQIVPVARQAGRKDEDITRLLKAVAKAQGFASTRTKDGHEAFVRENSPVLDKHALLVNTRNNLEMGRQTKASLNAESQLGNKAIRLAGLDVLPTSELPKNAMSDREWVRANSRNTNAADKAIQEEKAKLLKQFDDARDNVILIGGPNQLSAVFKKLSGVAHQLGMSYEEMLKKFEEIGEAHNFKSKKQSSGHTTFWREDEVGGKETNVAAVKNQPGGKIEIETKKQKDFEKLEADKARTMPMVYDEKSKQWAHPGQTNNEKAYQKEIERIQKLSLGKIQDMVAVLGKFAKTAKTLMPNLSAGEISAHMGALAEHHGYNHLVSAHDATGTQGMIAFSGGDSKHNKPNDRLMLTVDNQMGTVVPHRLSGGQRDIQNQAQRYPQVFGGEPGKFLPESHLMLASGDSTLIDPSLHNNSTHGGHQTVDAMGGLRTGPMPGTPGTEMSEAEKELINPHNMAGLKSRINAMRKEGHSENTIALHAHKMLAAMGMKQFLHFDEDGRSGSAYHDPTNMMKPVLLTQNANGLNVGHAQNTESAAREMNRVFMMQEHGEKPPIRNLAQVAKRLHDLHLQGAGHEEIIQEAEKLANQLGLEVHEYAKFADRTKAGLTVSDGLKSILVSATDKSGLSIDTIKGHDAHAKAMSRLEQFRTGQAPTNDIAYKNEGFYKDPVGISSTMIEIGEALNAQGKKSLSIIERYGRIYAAEFDVATNKLEKGIPVPSMQALVSVLNNFRLGIGSAEHGLVAMAAMAERMGYSHSLVEKKDETGTVHQAHIYKNQHGEDAYMAIKSGEDIKFHALGSAAALHDQLIKSKVFEKEGHERAATSIKKEAFFKNPELVRTGEVQTKNDGIIHKFHTADAAGDQDLVVERHHALPGRQSEFKSGGFISTLDMLLKETGGHAVSDHESNMLYHFDRLARKNNMHHLETEGFETSPGALHVMSDGDGKRHTVAIQTAQGLEMKDFKSRNEMVKAMVEQGHLDVTKADRLKFADEPTKKVSLQEADFTSGNLSHAGTGISLLNGKARQSSVYTNESGQVFVQHREGGAHGEKSFKEGKEIESIADFALAIKGLTFDTEGLSKVFEIFHALIAKTNGAEAIEALSSKKVRTHEEQVHTGEYQDVTIQKYDEIGHAIAKQKHKIENIKAATADKGVDHSAAISAITAEMAEAHEEALRNKPAFERHQQGEESIRKGKDHADHLAAALKVARSQERAADQHFDNLIPESGDKGLFENQSLVMRLRAHKQAAMSELHEAQASGGDTSEATREIESIDKEIEKAIKARQRILKKLKDNGSIGQALEASDKAAEDVSVLSQSYEKALTQLDAHYEGRRETGYEDQKGAETHQKANQKLGELQARKQALEAEHRPASASDGNERVEKAEAHLKELEAQHKALETQIGADVRPHVLARDLADTSLHVEGVKMSKLQERRRQAAAFDGADTEAGSSIAQRLGEVSHHITEASMTHDELVKQQQMHARNIENFDGLGLVHKAEASGDTEEASRLKKIRAEQVAMVVENAGLINKVNEDLAKMKAEMAKLIVEMDSLPELTRDVAKIDASIAETQAKMNSLHATKQHAEMEIQKASNFRSPVDIEALSNQHHENLQIRAGHQEIIDSHQGSEHSPEALQQIAFSKNAIEEIDKENESIRQRMSAASDLPAHLQPVMQTQSREEIEKQALSVAQGGSVMSIHATNGKVGITNSNSREQAEENLKKMGHLEDHRSEDFYRNGKSVQQFEAVSADGKTVQRVHHRDGKFYMETLDRESTHDLTSGTVSHKDTFKKGEHIAGMTDLFNQMTPDKFNVPIAHVRGSMPVGPDNTGGNMASTHDVLDHLAKQMGVNEAHHFDDADGSRSFMAYKGTKFNNKTGRHEEGFFVAIADPGTGNINMMYCKNQAELDKIVNGRPMKKTTITPTKVAPIEPPTERSSAEHHAAYARQQASSFNMLNETSGQVLHFFEDINGILHYTVHKLAHMDENGAITLGEQTKKSQGTGAEAVVLNQNFQKITKGFNTMNQEDAEKAFYTLRAKNTGTTGNPLAQGIPSSTVNTFEKALEGNSHVRMFNTHNSSGRVMTAGEGQYDPFTKGVDGHTVPGISLQTIHPETGELLQAIDVTRNLKNSTDEYTITYLKDGKARLEVAKTELDMLRKVKELAGIQLSDHDELRLNKHAKNEEETKSFRQEFDGARVYGAYKNRKVVYDKTLGKEVYEDSAIMERTDESGNKTQHIVRGRITKEDARHNPHDASAFMDMDKYFHLEHKGETDGIEMLRAGEKIHGTILGKATLIGKEIMKWGLGYSAFFGALNLIKESMVQIFQTAIKVEAQNHKLASSLQNLRPEAYGGVSVNPATGEVGKTADAHGKAVSKQQAENLADRAKKLLSDNAFDITDGSEILSTIIQGVRSSKDKNDRAQAPEKALDVMKTATQFARGHDVDVKQVADYVRTMGQQGMTSEQIKQGLESDSEMIMSSGGKINASDMIKVRQQNAAANKVAGTGDQTDSLLAGSWLRAGDSADNQGAAGSRASFIAAMNKPETQGELREALKGDVPDIHNASANKVQRVTLDQLAKFQRRAEINPQDEVATRRRDALLKVIGSEGNLLPARAAVEAQDKIHEMTNGKMSTLEEYDNAGLNNHVNKERSTGERAAEAMGLSGNQQGKAVQEFARALDILSKEALPTVTEVIKAFAEALQDIHSNIDSFKAIVSLFGNLAKAAVQITAGAIDGAGKFLDVLGKVANMFASFLGGKQMKEEPTRQAQIDKLKKEEEAAKEQAKSGTAQSSAAYAAAKDRREKAEAAKAREEAPKSALFTTGAIAAGVGIPALMAYRLASGLGNVSKIAGLSKELNVLEGKSAGTGVVSQAIRGTASALARTVFLPGGKMAKEAPEAIVALKNSVQAVRASNLENAAKSVEQNLVSDSKAFAQAGTTATNAAKVSGEASKVGHFGSALLSVSSKFSTVSANLGSFTMKMANSGNIFQKAIGGITAMLAKASSGVAIFIAKMAGTRFGGAVGGAAGFLGKLGTAGMVAGIGLDIVNGIRDWKVNSDNEGSKKRTDKLESYNKMLQGVTSLNYQVANAKPEDAAGTAAGKEAQKKVAAIQNSDEYQAIKNAGSGASKEQMKGESDTVYKLRKAKMEEYAKKGGDADTHVQEDLAKYVDQIAGILQDIVNNPEYKKMHEKNGDNMGVPRNTNDGKDGTKQEIKKPKEIKPAEVYDMAISDKNIIVKEIKDKEDRAEISTSQSARELIGSKSAVEGKFAMAQGALNQEKLEVGNDPIGQGKIRAKQSQLNAERSEFQKSLIEARDKLFDLATNNLSARYGELDNLVAKAAKMHEGMKMTAEEQYGVIASTNAEYQQNLAIQEAMLKQEIKRDEVGKRQVLRNQHLAELHAVQLKQVEKETEMIQAQMSLIAQSYDFQRKGIEFRQKVDKLAGRTQVGITRKVETMKVASAMDRQELADNIAVAIRDGGIKGEEFLKSSNIMKILESMIGRVEVIRKEMSMMASNTGERFKNYFAANGTAVQTDTVNTLQKLYADMAENAMAVHEYQLASIDPLKNQREVADSMNKALRSELEMRRTIFALQEKAVAVNEQRNQVSGKLALGTDTSESYDHIQQIQAEKRAIMRELSSLTGDLGMANHSKQFGQMASGKKAIDFEMVSQAGDDINKVDQKNALGKMHATLGSSIANSSNLQDAQAALIGMDRDIKTALSVYGFMMKRQFKNINSGPIALSEEFETSAIKKMSPVTSVSKMVGPAGDGPEAAATSSGKKGEAALAARRPIKLDGNMHAPDILETAVVSTAAKGAEKKARGIVNVTQETYVNLKPQQATIAAMQKINELALKQIEYAKALRALEEQHAEQIIHVRSLKQSQYDEATEYAAKSDNNISGSISFNQSRQLQLDTVKDKMEGANLDLSRWQDKLEDFMHAKAKMEAPGSNATDTEREDNARNIEKTEAEIRKSRVLKYELSLDARKIFNQLSPLEERFRQFAKGLEDNMTGAIYAAIDAYHQVPKPFEMSDLQHESRDRSEQYRDMFSSPSDSVQKYRQLRNFREGQEKFSYEERKKTDPQFRFNEELKQHTKESFAQNIGATQKFGIELLQNLSKTAMTNPGQLANLGKLFQRGDMGGIMEELKAQGGTKTADELMKESLSAYKKSSEETSKSIKDLATLQAGAMSTTENAAKKLLDAALMLQNAAGMMGGMENTFVNGPADIKLNDTIGGLIKDGTFKDKSQQENLKVVQQDMVKSGIHPQESTGLTFLKSLSSMEFKSMAGMSDVERSAYIGKGSLKVRQGIAFQTRHLKTDQNGEYHGIKKDAKTKYDASVLGNIVNSQVGTMNVQAQNINFKGTAAELIQSLTGGKGSSEDGFVKSDTQAAYSTPANVKAAVDRASTAIDKAGAHHDWKKRGDIHQNQKDIKVSGQQLVLGQPMFFAGTGPKGGTLGDHGLFFDNAVFNKKSKKWEKGTRRLQLGHNESHNPSLKVGDLVMPGVPVAYSQVTMTPGHGITNGPHVHGAYKDKKTGEFISMKGVLGFGNARMHADGKLTTLDGKPLSSGYNENNYYKKFDPSENVTLRNSNWSVKALLAMGKKDKKYAKISSMIASGDVGALNDYAMSEEGIKILGSHNAMFGEKVGKNGKTKKAKDSHSARNNEKLDDIQIVGSKWKARALVEMAKNNKLYEKMAKLIEAGNIDALNEYALTKAGATILGTHHAKFKHSNAKVSSSINENAGEFIASDSTDSTASDAGGGGQAVRNKPTPAPMPKQSEMDQFNRNSNTSAYKSPLAGFDETSLGYLNKMYPGMLAGMTSAPSSAPEQPTTQPETRSDSVVHRDNAIKFYSTGDSSVSTEDEQTGPANTDSTIYAPKAEGTYKPAEGTEAARLLSMSMEERLKTYKPAIGSSNEGSPNSLMDLSANLPEAPKFDLAEIFKNISDSKQGKEMMGMAGNLAGSLITSSMNPGMTAGMEKNAKAASDAAGNIGGSVGGGFGSVLGGMTPLGPLGAMLGGTIGKVAGDVLGRTLFGHSEEADRQDMRDVAERNAAKKLNNAMLDLGRQQVEATRAQTRAMQFTGQSFSQVGELIHQDIKLLSNSADYSGRGQDSRLEGLGIAHSSYGPQPASPPASGAGAASSSAMQFMSVPVPSDAQPNNTYNMGSENFINGAGMLHRAMGGDVPGQGNTDSVPAMLMPGEYVLTKHEVAELKRNGGISGGRFQMNAQHFATGGEVQAFNEGADNNSTGAMIAGGAAGAGIAAATGATGALSAGIATSSAAAAAGTAVTTAGAAGGIGGLLAGAGAAIGGILASPILLPALAIAGLVGGGALLFKKIMDDRNDHVRKMFYGDGSTYTNHNGMSSHIIAGNSSRIIAPNSSRIIAPNSSRIIAPNSSRMEDVPHFANGGEVGGGNWLSGIGNWFSHLFGGGDDIIAGNSSRLISDKGLGIIAGNSSRLISDKGLGLVSNNGASLVSNNGASIIAGNSSRLISDKGLGLVSNNGASIIAGNSSRLISDKGLGLVSNNGGGLVSNNGSSLLSNNGGGLVSNNGSSLLSNNGGGFSSMLHFALGGMVPGQGNTDSVPAMLMPGEYVMPKKSVQALSGYNGGMSNNAQMMRQMQLSYQSDPSQAIFPNLQQKVDVVYNTPNPLQLSPLQQEIQLNHTIGGRGGMNAGFGNNDLMRNAKSRGIN